MAGVIVVAMVVGKAVKTRNASGRGGERKEEETLEEEDLVLVFFQPVTQ